MTRWKWCPKRMLAATLLAWSAGGFGGNLAATEPPTSDLPGSGSPAVTSPAENTAADSPGAERAFVGKGVQGEAVEVQVDPQNPVTVICFLGTECPLARLYAPRLAELAASYGGRGVRFVGINSNRQDSTAEIQAFAREFALPFPILRDAGNVIADRYRATRTPEVFVLDSTLDVRYQGRIDDQYQPGITRGGASRHDLREAIDEVLAGGPVRVARTEAVGCLIGKVRQAPTGHSPSSVTYANQISRILQRHCLECHRQGEIGPFSLERYEEIVGWSDTILEVIADGRMPPWNADPHVGQFANARAMPDEDQRLLREWVAAGMPHGDAADLPPPLPTVDGWQFPREPDLVVPMREKPFTVPAQGTVEYQYFVVDPQFKEDRWIAGAQVIPGSRDVVHHAIVFIRPPDGTPFRGVGWLTAYVPGQRLAKLPEGYARKVPAGSKLVFQMHYTPNGTVRHDRSQVGMVFADPTQVTHEVLTLIGLDQDFEIPPHAASHEVRGEIRGKPDSGTLLAIAPHMHYRGKSFQLLADRAGRTEMLLNVPKYSFNWQHSYALAEPLPLDTLDRIHFQATFDNSATNPANPDPTQWVNWGDQTWEEMAVVFLEVAEPRQAAAVERHGGDPSPTPEREQRLQQFLDEFFAKLDANDDGVVRESEVPLAVRRLSFHRFDLDRDRKLTRDEVRRYMADRIR